MISKVAVTSIAQAFDQFKTRLELNRTFQDAVTSHHNAVQEWMQNHNGVNTKLIGSLQRRTRIQPRANQDTFDIDILVILGNFINWVSAGGITPVAALQSVEDIVSGNEIYNRMGPETASPTIFLEYEDGIKVELVPAYRDNVGHAPDGTSTLPIGRGYWIPKQNKWVIADYDYDAEYVKEKNEQSDGHLIPLIKMLKAAKRTIFSDMRSYHLEIMATNIMTGIIKGIQESSLPISYPNLVHLFFLGAQTAILQPVRVEASKSASASAYMSKERKQKMSEIFSLIAQHLASLYALNNQQQAIEGLREIFGESFPAYG